MAYKKYGLMAKENIVKKKQPNIQEVKELMKKIGNKMKEIKQKDKSTKDVYKSQVTQLGAGNKQNNI